MVEVELRPVCEIDPRLSRLDDWELLLALHHHADGYVGLITADARMLSQPREMAVLAQTQLSLVVAEGSGHDPVKATGLVLTHLPRIAALIRTDKPQVWTLTAQAPKPRTARDLIGELASRSKIPALELVDAAKLPAADLARDPLRRSRV